MNAIYLKLISELENLKMYDPEPEERALVAKRECELINQIYVMEHPTLEPMTEAELIYFERMIEEE